MSEFKEEHSVALLYGAPPGYVGYEEGGLLVNKIRQNPYSVVLFDEIEKAHKSVFDLFLQILDEGKLHDRLGRVGDFSNALILFTSNIGAQTIVEKFNSGVIPENNELMDIMQGYFRPEFLARLTEIVPFSPITDKTVTKIFDIHMKGLLKLLAEQNITLTLTPEARQAIALRGYNQQYGARPVIGIIRTNAMSAAGYYYLTGLALRNSQHQNDRKRYIFQSDYMRIIEDDSEGILTEGIPYPDELVVGASDYQPQNNYSHRKSNSQSQSSQQQPHSNTPVQQPAPPKAPDLGATELKISGYDLFQ